MIGSICMNEDTRYAMYSRFVFSRQLFKCSYESLRGNLQTAISLATRVVQTRKSHKATCTTSEILLEFRSYPTFWSASTTELRFTKRRACLRDTDDEHEQGPVQVEFEKFEIEM